MAQILDEKDQMVLLNPQKDFKFDSKQYFSIFFFSWVYPILKIGKKSPLTQEDLAKIDEKNKSKVSHEKFLKQFQQNRLIKSLYAAFQKSVLVQFTLYVIVQALFLGLPLITQQSQKFFMYDDPTEKPSNSSMFVFAIIQLTIMLSLSLIKPYQQFQGSLLSLKIQGSLQLEMLLKSLKFPIQRSQHYTSGELINMLQVDITQGSNYFNNAIILFTCPLQFIFCGIVFFLTLGDQAPTAIIGAIAQGGLGIAFGYFYGKVQKLYMIAKDQRMKAVDEALVFSKQVKLNTLEDFFEKRIGLKRSKELKQLKNQVLMLIFIQLMQGVLQVMTWELMFYFSETLNFAIVSLMMQNYANIITLLTLLPLQLKNYQMSHNSVLRLQNYFQQPEFQVIKPQIEESKLALNFIDGTYDWTSNDKIQDENEQAQNLNNQNAFKVKFDLRIQKGQFVAIVGNSASGKSTILKSILGETLYKQGVSEIHGKISIATQEPWIISGSIKKNITYLNPFDSVKYKKIIKICGLERDLSLFKNGDDTILSEKGDNLSGGQQKRINLARAVYNDADIYLLDDPMSALDIKVKYQIYQQCIQGYLKEKTRILFTNSLSNLQECDMIYMVENGQIVKQGTFAELTGVKQDGQLYSQKEIIDLQFEEQHYKYNSNDQDLRASLIQKEDQEKGNISKQVLLQIFNFIGKYWSIVVTLLFFVIVLACQLIGNAVMAKDNVPSNDYKRLAIIYYPFIQMPIVLANVFLMTFFLFKGLSTSKAVHQNVLHSLLNASYTKFYNTILIGRLMNRLSKDVYNIDLLFPSELQNLSLQFTVLSLPLFACFLYLNYAALPILVVFFIIMIYLTIIFYRCLREIARIEAVSKSPVFSFFQQIVRGIIYVRTCLSKEKIITLQQNNVDLDLGNQINLNGFQQWYQSLAGVITNIFQTGLFVVCFFFPGSSQKLTNLVLNQMQTFSQLLLNATISYGNMQMYFISFERCLHLANNIEQEERDLALITPGQEQNNQKQENQNIVLNLSNCTFQYRSNQKSVLSSINFKLHKGEKIGVVGRTGAGKSSIILALTQILEQTEGHIEIEGKNINFFTMNELRKKYSIIPQDPIIFMGTLKQNLDPLNQFPAEKLLEVAQNCGLLEMQSFSQLGLESEIEVQGSNLSLGEKQLLNIARCILEDKQIILVDEATANIDQKTEEHVKELFEKYFRSAAMITIAHKVTTIMNSDKIMVLNDGTITEFDNPQKLLTNPNSEFKKIIELIKQSEQL